MWVNRGTAPYIRDASSDGGEQSTSRPDRFITAAKRPRYYLNSAMGGPHRRPEGFGDEKKPLFLLGIEHPLPQSSSS